MSDSISNRWDFVEQVTPVIPIVSTKDRLRTDRLRRNLWFIFGSSDLWQSREKFYHTKTQVPCDTRPYLHNLRKILCKSTEMYTARHAMTSETTLTTSCLCHVFSMNRSRIVSCYEYNIYENKRIFIAFWFKHTFMCESKITQTFVSPRQY